jgi:uncharacterized membrane protein YedE/YeeE
VYFNALIGGMLIGLSASLLLWLNGRVAGVSGIFGGLLSGRGRDRWWRLAFVCGLLLSGWLVSLVDESALTNLSGRNFWQIGLAGLLVGFGTRTSGGCTSGHGVCGLSRLSKRSFAATLIFMSFGILTASFLGFWSGR